MSLSESAHAASPSGPGSVQKVDQKRVLIVSYHFPPDAAVGAIRPAKFVKYLPHFGWTPYVLTAKERSYDFTDVSRTDSLGAAKRIFRVGPSPDPSQLYMQLKGWAYRVRGRGRVFEEERRAYWSQRVPDKEGRLRRLRRGLRSLLAVVDRNLLRWAVPATFTAFWILRRYKIRWIHTSGPPHGAHLIGLAMRRLAGARWIADFRDPWTQIPQKPAHETSRLSETLEGWLEAQVIRRADAVVSVTGRMTEAFMRTYPAIDRTKFATIPNGYDPEDFVGLPCQGRKDKFRISYLGTFYLERTPAQFLKALRELIDERKLPPDDLEIRFIGHCRHSMGQSVEEMTRQEGLSGVVRIMDPLPYRDALQEMTDAHVLLLFAPNQADMIPAKAFEYLASGADIIAFTSEGATSDLIRDTGRGTVVEPDSLEEIKKAVEASYERYKACKGSQRDHPSAHQALERYHRKTLSKELALILE